MKFIFSSFFLVIMLNSYTIAQKHNNKFEYSFIIEEYVIKDSSIMTILDSIVEMKNICLSEFPKNSTFISISGLNNSFCRFSSASFLDSMEVDSKYGGFYYKANLFIIEGGLDAQCLPFFLEKSNSNISFNLLLYYIPVGNQFELFATKQEDNTYKIDIINCSNCHTPTRIQKRKLKKRKVKY